VLLAKCNRGTKGACTTATEGLRSAPSRQPVSPALPRPSVASRRAIYLQWGHARHTEVLHCLARPSDSLTPPPDPLPCPPLAMFEPQEQRQGIRVDMPAETGWRSEICRRRRPVLDFPRRGQMPPFTNSSSPAHCQSYSEIHLVLLVYRKWWMGYHGAGSMPEAAPSEGTVPFLCPFQQWRRHRNQINE
jgi:hypothetical protein